jgi:glycosyltransferase involved in cell wall biosynthesis
LISNAGSLPKVGGDAACYFDPDSVQSMTQGILKMLTDPAYRKTLSEAGRLQVEKYSWRRNAMQTLDVCRTVVTAVRSKSKRPVGFPVAHDQSKGK